MTGHRRVQVRLLIPGQVIQSPTSPGGRATVRGITEPLPGVRRLHLADAGTGQLLGTLTLPMNSTVVIDHT